jgi:hypothetical protein
MITFEGLDTLCGMSLHTLKDYDPVSRCLDVGVENSKLPTDPMLRDLIFDQPLDRLLETHLILSDTDCPEPRLRNRIVYESISKEVRFPAATSTIDTLIPSRSQEWLEDRRYRNIHEMTQ